MLLSPSDFKMDEKVPSKDLQIAFKRLKSSSAENKVGVTTVNLILFFVRIKSRVRFRWKIVFERNIYFCDI